jgi:DNA helicase-2/ATP-dependent DNA helicase PcrA
MVYYASLVLPTCVVGDPLQAIFGFGSDRLAGWEKHVRAHFPLVAELSQPWRWINAGTPALGKWLLECRVALLAGRSIDLTKAPSEVLWVQLDGSNSDYEKRLRVCLTSAPDSQGSVVIIGDSRSPDSQRRVASQTPGAVTIEAVDLKDLVTFAREFDVEASDALTRLLEFAENVMTNAGVRALETRLASIKGRRARTPPTAVERTALAFEGDRTQMRAAELLVEINKQPGVRAHRPEILRACLRGLDTSGGSTGVSFGDAVVRIREQKRYLGRALPRRAVGSTLLLKGLEAATVVVLDADGLDASNLYVALTRGSQRLVICSRSHLLQPA